MMFERLLLEVQYLIAFDLAKISTFVLLIDFPGTGTPGIFKRLQFDPNDFSWRVYFYWK